MRALVTGSVGHLGEALVRAGRPGEGWPLLERALAAIRQHVAWNASATALANLSFALGAVADLRAAKRGLLIALTLICIVPTALLGFVGPGDLAWGLILFAIANVGYNAALHIYDAFLKELAPPTSMYSTSANPPQQPLCTSTYPTAIILRWSQSWLKGIWMSLPAVSPGKFTVPLMAGR